MDWYYGIRSKTSKYRVLSVAEIVYPLFRVVRYSGGSDCRRFVLDGGHLENVSYCGRCPLGEVTLYYKSLGDLFASEQYRVPETIRCIYLSRLRGRIEFISRSKLLCGGFGSGPMWFLTVKMARATGHNIILQKYASSEPVYVYNTRAL